MYKRSEQGWLKHLDFIILDILSMQIAYMLAYGLRHGFSTIVYGLENYRNLGIWMALFNILVSIMFNTMHDVLKRGPLAEIRQTLTQGLLVFSLVIIFLFSVKDSEAYSRIVLWVTLLIYIVVSILLRTIWKRLLLRRYSGENGRVMLLVTDSSSVSRMIRRFNEHPIENIKLSGIVLTDRAAKGELIEDIPVTANLEEAALYICREWIDEVYVGVADTSQTPYDFLEKCRQMGVTTHLEVTVNGMGRQVVEKIAGASVVTNSMNVATPIQLLIKRTMDIAGGFLLSLFALLTIIFVGPMIKLKSPGPILYRQERIGQNGRKFKMYKLRSMYTDADARKQELMSQNRVSDGMMFKLDFDPRIIGNEILPDGTKKTGIGEFIRKTSLDELPQGFNVLIGQMSLVGTRPPTVDEWERYEYHHRARLSTKPGITGMWQASGRSQITDFEEVVKLDTEYINNWSVSLDIRILLKTVKVVFTKDGAL